VTPQTALTEDYGLRTPDNCIHHWFLLSSGASSPAVCVYCARTRTFSGGVDFDASPSFNGAIAGAVNLALRDNDIRLSQALMQRGH